MIVGILALVLGALVLVLAVQANGSSEGGVAGPGSMATEPSAGVSGGGTSANAAERIAIRLAMQKFVDAVNSRDVAQIQAAVCSVVRPQVTEPLDITGNVVLEELRDVTVTGDSAASTVITHIELGQQRTTSERNDEVFVRENGLWYVCPGVEPDIGT
ncbi:hypothetical protein [Gordonia rhizosphera]|uniref:hypothetical protein n=1 Tax=Gordonia rhizosphera TaxID=83341 RepID=UPI000304BDB7|nr:hypothetical protein [Gordonia rhizosphera]